MERIFTQIKNKVNSIVSQNPPEESWGNFQKYRRRRNSGNAWGAYWPWLLGSVGMFLLFSNIYFISHSYKLKEQFAGILSDTIYITKYITEQKSSEGSTEKILSEIEYQNLLEQQKNLAQLQNQYDNLNNKFALLNSGVQTLRSENQELRLAMDYSKNKSEALNGLNNQNTNQTISSKLNSGDDPYNNLFDSDKRSFLDDIGLLDINLSLLEQKNKTFRSPRPWIDPVKPGRSFNLLEAIRPKAFALDLNGGLLDTRPTYDSHEGFHYGISGLIAFSSHFRIKLGIKSWILLSNLEDDIDDYPELPEITFPEDGTLKEIQINTNNFAFSGSAEYMFNPIGRFRPFVGVGWLEQIDKKDNYNFEFNTPTGELYLSKEAHYGGPNLHFLSFSVGSDINLYDRLDAYLAVQYSREVKGLGQEYLFFQPGFYYHF